MKFDIPAKRGLPVYSLCWGFRIPDVSIFGGREDERMLTGLGCSGFDVALTRFWDWNNRGVSESLSTLGLHIADLLQRQWKDIRHKYVESGE